MKQQHQAKFTIISPHGQRTEYPITATPVSIGRNEQNMIVLFDERASRFHAVIEQNGSSFVIRDDLSRNGTFVNGLELPRKVNRVLIDGDEIRVGNFRLQFHLTQASAANLDYDDRPIAEGTVVFKSAADLLKPLTTLSGDVSRLASGGFPSVHSGGKPSQAEAAVSPFTVIDQSFATEMEILAKRSRILEFVYELNKMLNRVFKIEEIYEKIAEQIFKISNAGRIIFAQPNEEEVEINWGKYRDESVLKKYDGIPVSRTIIRRVIRDRVSLLSVDPMADPGLKQHDTFRLGRIRSVMCVPMLGQEEKVLGAIYVDRPDPISFTNEDLNFLTALAANSAMAVENIKVHEKLLHDAEARLAYQRFLPPFVVEQIMADPDSLELGGVNQIVTVLFADIRGFTTLSERKSPQEIVSLLNRYFERAAAAIFKYNGTLDKFIGDGIMALFGAPKPSDADAVNAIQAAIELKRQVTEFNQELAAENSDIQLTIGIGINTGEVTVGYIGSKLRTDYTVIGDPVNLAARLESNAKNGQILIGEQTYVAARAYMLGLHDEVLNSSLDGTAWSESGGQKFDFSMRPIGGLKVKGKTKSVQVYQVYWDGQPPESKLEPISPPPQGSPDPKTAEAGAERRKEPRIFLAIKLQIRGVGIDGRPFEEVCVTEDVSVSGACLALVHEVRVGDQLLIRGIDSVFQSQAEVRSVKFAHNHYRTGIQFISNYPIWQLK